MQPLVGAQGEHHFENLRIGSKALAVRHRIDHSGSRHNLKALVDADEEFGRVDTHLNGAKLRTFDLARNRTKLACRINLGLDAPPESRSTAAAKFLARTCGASLSVGSVIFIT